MSIDIIMAVIAGIVIQVVISLVISRYSQVKKYVAIKRQVRELQEKVTLLESAHQDAPFPTWLKDTLGMMLALNPAYEQVFLVPLSKKRSDYLYHSDYDIWPQELADEFNRNDKYVLRTKKPWQGYETIVDHQGKKAQWRIIKWPRTVGGVIIGIAGVAIPPD